MAIRRPTTVAAPVYLGGPAGPQGNAGTPGAPGSDASVTGANVAAVIGAAMATWLSTLPTSQPPAGSPGWWSNGGQPTYFAG